MFEHINTHYGVNACIGRRVIAYGKPGTIVKDFGHYIGIVLDDDLSSEPGRYHPVDGIEYGDVIEVITPKINSRKLRAKRQYSDFRNADYGHDFHEWLGINIPQVEYDGKGKCRMYRYERGYGGYTRGEWCATKKDAKASYKQALANLKQ